MVSDLDWDPNIPTAVAEETVRIGNLEIKVYSLDNGERVIEEADFDKLIAWMGITREEAAEMLRKIQRERNAATPSVKGNVG